MAGDRRSDRDRDLDSTDPAIDPAAVDLTSEVGDEGGSPGDVEVASDRGPGAGSEHAETWRATDNQRRVVTHDETGTGKRSP